MWTFQLKLINHIIVGKGKLRHDSNHFIKKILIGFWNHNNEVKQKDAEMISGHISPWVLYEYADMRVLRAIDH